MLKQIVSSDFCEAEKYLRAIVLAQGFIVPNPDPDTWFEMNVTCKAKDPADL